MKLAIKLKLTTSDNEGSYPLETRTTPSSKGKKRNFVAREEVNPRRENKNEKERNDSGGALASSLGATQILEVMTKHLSISALSPLGLDLTSLLLTMKDA